eukprot:Seg16217.2 transcript_id=Seg16217.2/GoldUCD/mRNA.D3Y31 product="Type 4 prepilin-like proteins leader peptide-processing enzyme" protein_id=Seg16217.2/GoldUCD/D3Y31
MSVNEPKRSFCPICKKAIPVSRNIPLFTWLIQRGKCAECSAPIPARYFILELLTGLLWLGCWYYFSDPVESIFYMALSVIFLVIWAVDVELMLIPRVFTVIGAVIGLAGGALMPERFDQVTWQKGLAFSAYGLAIGWFCMWLVVLLGKAMFGQRKFEFDSAMEWSLREPKEEVEDDELTFIIDGEEIPWSDIFYRKTDKLVFNDISSLIIDGKSISAQSLEIREYKILLDGKERSIESLKSLEGKTSSAVIPREAMGMGDVDLLAVIGACFGAPSLILIVMVACVFGLLWGILNRIGIGNMFPFGPSLIVGAVFWVFWGQETWDWYLNLVNFSQ